MEFRAISRHSREHGEKWHSSEELSGLVVARMFPEPTCDSEHRDALAA